MYDLKLKVPLPNKLNIAILLHILFDMIIYYKVKQLLDHLCCLFMIKLDPYLSSREAAGQMLGFGKAIKLRLMLRHKLDQINPRK